MTPAALADLLAVLAIFHSGRTQEGVDALAEVIRKHGAQIEQAPTLPLWMRTNA